MNYFSLGKKQKSLGARTTHLITGQPKHWLPSKMSALNYSVTASPTVFAIRVRIARQMAGPGTIIIYNGVRTLEKCWTKCISVAGVYVQK